MATRCFIPPESSRGYRRFEPAEPHGLEEGPGALAPGLSAGTPWSSSPNSTFSSAVRQGKSPGSWKTIAI